MIFKQLFLVFLVSTVWIQSAILTSPHEKSFSKRENEISDNDEDMTVRKKQRTEAEDRVSITNAGGDTLTSLTKEIFILIASYLKSPFSELGFLNKTAMRYLFHDILLRHRVAFLYSRSKMPDLTVTNHEFTSDLDLPWFLQQSFELPRRQLFKNFYFLNILTTALTYNLYFPQNGKYISKLILEAVLEMDENERLKIVETRIYGSGSTIPLSLGNYFIETEQHDLLFKLSNAFPAEEVEERPLVEPEVNQNHRLAEPLTESSELEDQFVLFDCNIVDRMKEFSSSAASATDPTQFEQLFDSLINEIVAKYKTSPKEELYRPKRSHYECLIKKVMSWAFDNVSSSTGPYEQEYDHFAAYIKILMKWKFRGTIAQESTAITADHETILKLYLYPELHQFFKNYTVKMDSESLLYILRSPDHFEVFQSLFSQFGRLIEFEYFDILQFLRPNSEYKLFEELTGLDLSDCIIKKYLQCPNANQSDNNKFFFQHRSLFMYCLHSGNDGRLVKIGLKKVSKTSANHALFILIRKDSPAAKKKLIDDFQNIFNGLGNESPEEIVFFKSRYNEIFAHYH